MVEAINCLIGPAISILISLFKRIKCPKIQAVVIPKFSGKTSFINTVNSNELLLLDLEANVKLTMTADEQAQLDKLTGQSFNLHYFPICKAYLNDIIKKNPGKSFVVFVSSIDLAKYCQIKSIHSFVPCSELSDRIKQNLGEHMQKAFDNCKNDILVKLKPNQLHVFSSWENLAQQLCAKFNLVSKL